MTKQPSYIQFQARATALLRSTSAAVLATTLAGGIAFAQDADDSGVEEDEIVATGIRSSLDRAQDIKRNADTFVDSITASDIAALPDPSVLESLQRVPGVSISRFAAGDDPDHFSVEGSGLVIRGLNFVRSEFNGRDAFTANNGRALSFNDVPPELVGGVDVFKNQTADMVEGGISGIVNLRTVVPFDTDEDFVLAGQAEYTYTDLAEEWSPAGSVLMSKRWDTAGGGEFGLLGNISYSNLQSRSDGLQISPLYPYNVGFSGGPAGPDADGNITDIAAPAGANIRTQFFDRDRLGIALAGQWASADDKFLATAQFIRSDASNAWNEFAMVSEEDPNTRAGNFALGAFGTTGYVGEVPTTRDNTTPTSVNGLFQNGVISSSTAGWYSNGGPGLPGVRMANGTRFSDTDTVTSDYSFNLKWTPNDRIKTNFDVQYVDATTQNQDISVFVAQPLNINLNLGNVPSGGDLTGLDPTVSYEVGATGADGNPLATTDPVTAYWRAAMDHFEDSEGDELALRADIEIDIGNDFIKAARFGARYADRDQTTRWSLYNWGNLSEEWAGGANRFSEITENTTQFTFDNFLRGDVLSGNNSFLFASPGLVENYDSLVAFANSAGFGNYGGHLRGEASRDSLFNPNEIAQVSEETAAFYARMDFGQDSLFNSGMTLDGNVGVRLVQTTVESQGFRAYGGFNQCTDANTVVVNDAGLCNFVNAQSAADSTEFVAENTFTNALPSLNVKLGISDELILRFAAAKAISRPDTGLYRASQIVNGQFTTISDMGVTPQISSFVRATVQGGNPALRPVEATKFDASLEWYFDDVGSLTLSLFHQDLDGIITNDFGTVDIGGGFVGEFSGPRNQADGKVKGFEIAYQQTFDFLPGFLADFGAQANYTYVDQSSIPLSTVNGVRPDAAIEFTNSLPVDRLEQLSDHTINLVGFYETDLISARLAYNWRSEYLLTGSDVITRLPVFNEATGQLDGSFRVNVTDNFTLGVQGVNLLSEVTETSMQFNAQGDRITRSLFENDRRVSFLAAFRF